MEQEIQQLRGQVNDERVEANHQEALEVMSRRMLEDSDHDLVSEACLYSAKKKREGLSTNKCRIRISSRSS